ncbi:MAG TPA: PaaI family thioesterase [Rhizomicrobium sp.]|nr:PaaI family thioesterase [Rhizomicrobium sp.]
MRSLIDNSKATDYPPNIQAIIKRPSEVSAWLGQSLLEIDTDTGWVKIAYQLTNAHFNRYGGIHGGVIAAIMDDVIATAGGLRLQWGEIAPTLEMKVNYLAPPKEGRQIAEARAVKRGKTIVFLESSLSTEDGKLLATASATLMITALKKN